MSYQPATLGKIKCFFSALLLGLLGSSFAHDTLYLGRLGCTAMHLSPFHYASSLIVAQGQVVQMTTTTCYGLIPTLYYIG
ncbi:hypothetical protein F5B22DRAFT_45281 [Xylaria bambusicola]|uniref:uncharacterized protein n=1 Tax=Xylaria bambusicola TaxID=326684 RepID=UPI0020079FD6|nr:uncharacterized protein F5B22DRAFT_45281 [Xylaria bambusicola]KAI0502820.1 hypothetical protein F5B22DRAFT_45281 [Xylaria bambusicola]